MLQASSRLTETRAISNNHLANKAGHQAATVRRRVSTKDRQAVMDNPRNSTVAPMLSTSSRALATILRISLTAEDNTLLLPRNRMLSKEVTERRRVDISRKEGMADNLGMGVGTMVMHHHRRIRGGGKV